MPQELTLDVNKSVVELDWLDLEEDGEVLEANSKRVAVVEFVLVVVDVESEVGFDVSA